MRVFRYRTHKFFSIQCVLWGSYYIYQILYQNWMCVVDFSFVKSFIKLNGGFIR